MKRVQELHRQGLLFNSFHSTLAVDLVVSIHFRPGKVASDITQVAVGLDGKLKEK